MQDLFCYECCFHSGVGFVGGFWPLPDNSAFITDSDGEFGVGRLTCHSASTAPDIGNWFDPRGFPILPISDGTSLFLVNSLSGTLHSYTSLAIQSGHSFGAADQGVYSCVIPDELGNLNALNVGIYPNSYNGEYTGISGCIPIYYFLCMIKCMTRWTQNY